MGSSIVENAYQTGNAASQQAVQWCGGRGTPVRARRAQQELDLAGNGLSGNAQKSEAPERELDLSAKRPSGNAPEWETAQAGMLRSGKRPSGSERT